MKRIYPLLLLLSLFIFGCSAAPETPTQIPRPTEPPWEIVYQVAGVGNVGDVQITLDLPPGYTGESLIKTHGDNLPWEQVFSEVDRQKVELEISIVPVVVGVGNAVTCKIFVDGIAVSTGKYEPEPGKAPLLVCKWAHSGD